MLEKFLPPTDNLYKFIAISGLLLIVLALFPFYLSFRVGEQEIAATSQRSIIEEQEFAFRGDLLELEKARSPSEIRKVARSLGISETSDAFYDAVLKKDYSKLDSKLAEKIENLEKEAELKSDEIQKKSTELKNNHRLISFYKAQIKLLIFVSIIIFILGFTASCLGFYAWYFKIQKINDQILLNNASENLKNKRKKPRGIKPM